MIITEKWRTFDGKTQKEVTEMIKVRVIRQFNDKTEGFITRPVNETFECSDSRAEQLIAGGFVELVPDNAKKTKSTD